jgi:hypothetical protein
MLVVMRITIELDEGTDERPTGVIRWDQVEERLRRLDRTAAAARIRDALRDGRPRRAQDQGFPGG